MGDKHRIDVNRHLQQEKSIMLFAPKTLDFFVCKNRNK